MTFWSSATINQLLFFRKKIIICFSQQHPRGFRFNPLACALLTNTKRPFLSFEIDRIRDIIDKLFEQSFFSFKLGRVFFFDGRILARRKQQAVSIGGFERIMASLRTQSIINIALFIQYRSIGHIIPLLSIKTRKTNGQNSSIRLARVRAMRSTPCILVEVPGIEPGSLGHGI